MYTVTPYVLGLRIPCIHDNAYGRRHAGKPIKQGALSMAT
jgi:hypothetical protein